MTEPDFDAVVVGASVAGCTAARLFAQRGARVALVERRPDVDAYKTVCTHYIQPSATPTIEKLGLAALIEEHGAVRNSIDLWTPYGGWIRHRGDAPYGYNVTRQVLDPLLRRLTAATPGVELLSGYTATAGSLFVESIAIRSGSLSRLKTWCAPAGPTGKQTTSPASSSCSPSGSRSTGRPVRTSSHSSSYS